MARIFAAIVVAVALAAMVGWLAGIPFLKEVYPGQVSMKMNTALSLIGCGLALWLASSGPRMGRPSSRARVIAVMAATVPVVIGTLSGLEYLLHADFHIDQLFFTDPKGSIPGHPAGRMSPITAANLIFLGSALLGLALRRPPPLVQLLAASSGFLSLVVLTGTSYGLEELMDGVHYAAVALHTNLCFMLLFGGILCATGEQGAMRLLTDPGTAGKLLRRLLPTAVLVPLLVSSLTAGMERVHWLSPEFGVSVFSITTIMAFAGLVWWSSVFLHRSENETRQTASRLRETLSRYSFLAEAMPEMVWTAKPDGSVEYFNERWLKYGGLTIEQSRNWGWKVMLHPDDLQRCLDRWNESLRTGCAYEIEYRLKAADGSYRWFLGRASPLRDEQGAILQWVGSCTDIDEQKRARNELEQRVLERTAEVAGARERLQAVLDSATQVAIIAVDRRGWITLFNRGAENIFGYTSAEVVGQHTPAVFHVEWQVAARARELSEKYGRPIQGFDVFVENVRHGETEEREWTLVRKDGSHFPASLIISAMRDGSGEITGFLGIVTDISTRRQADKLLHDQAVILDLANESIFIRDVNDLVTYWNQGAQRLYGWTKDEALGRVTHELLHTIFPQPLAEIRAELLENGSWQGELIHNTRDGSLVTVASSWTLQQDDSGEPISVIEINHDITARKRAEETLRASEKRFRLIVDAVEDYAIYMLNPHGYVVSWNAGAERIKGYAMEDIIGRHFSQFYTEEDNNAGRPERALRVARETGHYSEEGWRVRQDGTRFLAEVNLRAIHDDTGELRGFAEVMRDITERKLYEKELQDAKVHAELADRAKSNFLANMSHEIRTPMNGVIGLTGLLLETDLDAEQRGLSETIRTSAESLLGVINDILDFSKIEAGKLTIEQIDFDLRKVVEETLEVMAGLAQAKGLELAGGVEPGTVTRLRGDPTRVQQVLTNLIGNALKFTPSGEIAIKLAAQAETDSTVTIRCEVRDTGLGIVPQVQAQLFQPFVQADTSTSRQFGGTGLGLAICKRLAEAMNGSIGVQSAPGEGSTFWVTMQFSRQGPAAADLAAPDAFANARVLVVDDNATSRDFLQRQLAAWRMRGDGTATAESALDLLRDAAAANDPYAVALVDHHMPATDGLVLAHLIHSDPNLRATRVVLLTPLGKLVPSGEVAPPNLAACCIKPTRHSALFDCLVQALAKPAGSGLVRPISPRMKSLPTVPSKKERILLAEDHPVNQEVALGNLRKLGYHADVAANGLEVLYAVEAKPYDIILMDCQMPELDGYEATRQLRQRERDGHRTRIIAMTANAMVGDREKCLAAGMDDYVSKPLRRADLRAALERNAPKPVAPFSEKILRGIVDDEPGELAKLVEIFVATAPGSIQKMRAAFDKKSASDLAMAAHALKGSCGSLGATSLREICARLEQNAREGDLSGADEMIATAALELPRLTEALLSYIHSKAAA